MIQVDGYNKHKVSVLQRREHGSSRWGFKPDKNSVFYPSSCNLEHCLPGKVRITVLVNTT